jgi:hypothetical protein
MYRIWLTSVVYSISHLLRVSDKKSINVKCVVRFSLQILSEKFLILGIIVWDIINVHTFSIFIRKATVILLRFRSFNFPSRFRKILIYQISWKSIQWEPSFSIKRTKEDERTDNNENTSRFSHFLKRLVGKTVKKMLQVEDYINKNI